MSKLLIVSLHPRGGCYQYSSEIIKRIKINKSVYLNEIIEENNSLKEYKTLKCYGFSTLTRYWELFWFCTKIFFGGITKHYDALLLMGLTTWDPYIARAFSLTGRKIFYTLHDGKVHLGEDARTQNKILTTLKYVTNIVYLSDYVRKIVENDLGVVRDSFIAPHGLIDYGKIPLDIKRKRRLPKLLYFGRLSEYKGLEYLLEGINKLNPSLYNDLLIVGKTIGNYKIECNNPKVRIEDKWLTECEIVELLLDYDILIMPYVEATQSGIATLAINYLIPTITTDVGALREQFQNDSAVFIEKCNSEAIKVALEKLICDDNLYNSLSLKMFNLRKVYSWDKITSDFQQYLVTSL